MKLLRLTISQSSEPADRHSREPTQLLNTYRHYLSSGRFSYGWLILGKFLDFLFDEFFEHVRDGSIFTRGDFLNRRKSIFADRNRRLDFHLPAGNRSVGECRNVLK
jgi:hypothetical protein